MKKLICLVAVALSVVSIFADNASAARRKRCRRGGCGVHAPIGVRFDAPLQFVPSPVLLK